MALNMPKRDRSGAPPKGLRGATVIADQPCKAGHTPALFYVRSAACVACSRAAAAKSKVLADWASVELFGAANRCAAARTRRVQPSKKARHRRTREMAGRQSVCQCSCLCCAVSCALA